MIYCNYSKYSEIFFRVCLVIFSLIFGDFSLLKFDVFAYIYFCCAAYFGGFNSIKYSLMLTATLSSFNLH